MSGASARPAPRESWRTRLMRWGFNLHPAYRGTGARVTFIAADWSEIRIRLPLSWRTRNIVGTIFGGSLYAAADPMFMIMLMRRLGPGYEVWDKAARIRFRRPGRSTLTARFTLPAAEVEAVRRLLEREERVDREYEAELVDAAGEVHAVVGKTIHVRRAGAGGGERRPRS